jgi:raffinose/stachyose/melibiose transport system permease protein
MAAFLFPAFALILVFSYYPAFSGLFHSFTDWDIGGSENFVGLDNFIKMWSDDVFLISMKNALQYAVFRIVVYVSVPLFVALLIFHLRGSRARYLYRVGFLIPYIVPSVVYWLVWGFVYAPYDGILNSLLEAVGLENLTKAWLGNPDTALYAIMFIGFPFVGAFFMLILYAGLEGIGSAVFDAAEIDGAGATSRLLRIELPLIRPQIMLILILSAIEGFSSYAVALILTSGGPMNATMFPGLYMYRNAFQFGRMGYAASIGTILFIILFVLAVFSQRYRKQT